MAKKEFKQNDNNFAVAYYRYSSHNQRDESIEQQREKAEAYAAKYYEEHSIEAYFDNTEVRDSNL